MQQQDYLSGRAYGRAGQTHDAELCEIGPGTPCGEYMRRFWQPVYRAQDLPAGQASGLRIVQDILEGLDDVHFSRLTSHDVVRHRLVGDIVDAYERYDARVRESPAPQRRKRVQ